MPGHTHETDSKAAGDPGTPSPEILNLLVENHRRFLSFLEHRVESREAAEDILQEAFVRGLSRSRTLRDEESATAWFYRMLRNALVDHYRRRASEQRAMEKVAADLGGAEPAFDEEMMRTVCDCALSLLPALKPEYQEILRRVDLDGAGVAAFAGEAKITPNNAAVRLHRARAALRRQVERSCGTCATHGCFDCNCGAAGSGCAS